MSCVRDRLTTLSRLVGWLARLVLVASISCANSGDRGGEAPAEACGPEDSGAGVCPVDSCARACSSPDAALACCVATHGRGLTEEEALTLADYCAPEDCDPALYITKETAVCAAQVHGQSPGIGACATWFKYFPSGPAWEVFSLTDPACENEGDTHFEATSCYIDGATSRLIVMGIDIEGTAVCH